MEFTFDSSNNDNSNKNAAKHKKVKLTEDSVSEFIDEDAYFDDNGTSKFMPNREGFSIDQYRSFFGTHNESAIATEFMSLCKCPPNGTYKDCGLPENRLKCRYPDVLCLDSTRVHLKPNERFIHANWVDGYRRKNMYICTQGPLPSTLEDFWMMVYQFNVSIIVMTTKLVEKGKTKCHLYWPKSEGLTEQYGSFIVENISVEKTPSLLVSRLLVYTASKEAQKKKLIHYYFIGWPDFDVPVSSEEFMDFVLRVQTTYDGVRRHFKDKNAQVPPILVHCSAGIGRTGTFIVVDICIRRLNDQRLVDIKSVTNLVRCQRVGAVQTPSQYFFIYRTIFAYVEKNRDWLLKKGSGLVCPSV